MPGFSAPIRPSRPAVRAPAIVADQIASAAVGGPGSGSQTAASAANIFIDWNMFCASLQLQLSQPRPTFTLCLMYDRMGGTPLRVLRFPTGLRTTLVPASPSVSISRGDIHTLWARLSCGDNRPTRSR